LHYYYIIYLTLMKRDELITVLYIIPPTATLCVVGFIAPYYLLIT